LDMHMRPLLRLHFLFWEENNEVLFLLDNMETRVPAFCVFEDLFCLSVRKWLHIYCIISSI
jgi:hypothetical protein